MDRYSINSFRWSQGEYTLKEAVESFRHNFPFLVTVTQGYSGRDGDSHEIPVDEVSWVHTIVKQSRILVKDDADKYLSIPESFEEEIVAIAEEGKVGRQMPVADLINVHKPTQYFRFASQLQRSRVYDGAADGDIYKLGRLQFVDAYDERFLLAHTLSQGYLHPDFILIPMYMPITISIALGTTQGGLRTFFETMMGFKTFVEKQPHEYEKALSAFRDIMVFDGKPDTGDYDYITVVPLQQANRRRSAKQEALTKIPVEMRTGEIAFGVSPEDRLAQMKHIFYSKVVPSDIEDDEQQYVVLKRSSEQIKPDLQSKTDVQTQSKAKGTLIKKIGKRFGSISSKHSTTGKHIKESKQKENSELSTSVRKEAADTDTASCLSTRRTPQEPYDMEQSGFNSQTYAPLIPHTESKPKKAVLPPKPTLQKRAPPPLPAVEDVETHSRSTSKEQKPRVNSPTAGFEQKSHVRNHTAGFEQKSHVHNPTAGFEQKSRVHSPTAGFEQKSRVHSPTAGFVTLSDVPNDLAGLNLLEVSRCLELLNLSAFKDTFKDNLVDGELLGELNESILVSDFGMPTFSARKVIKFVGGWRPK